MEEQRSALVKMKGRYQMHNFGVLKAVYTDRPDQDKRIWEEVWPELCSSADAERGDTTAVSQSTAPPVAAAVNGESSDAAAESNVVVRRTIVRSRAVESFQCPAGGHCIFVDQLAQVA